MLGLQHRQADAVGLRASGGTPIRGETLRIESRASEQL
jgi:hypothetical protein